MRAKVPVKTSGSDVAASGFSLIELMMTLAILAVILGIAAPALSSFVKNSRVTGKTNDFLANLAVARSESAKRGVRVTICASSNSTTPTPSCTGGGSTGWNQGYIVFADANADGAYTAGTDTLLRVAEALGTNSTLASTGLTNADWLQYRPSGNTNVPASGGSFKLCDDRAGNFGRTITISITGRTQVTPVICP
jgi:type IV fimbrial biogenesis protein FimT